ncbi:MAG: hypothetical protein IPO64_09760 [Bacteroidetes bacterium]|nr:hypothetical protein [Bacteroidota bacterium]
MLIFYGLASINGSKFTPRRNKVLGIYGNSISLIAAVNPKFDYFHGVLIWNFTYFYRRIYVNKYERTENKNQQTN